MWASSKTSSTALGNQNVTTVDSTMMNVSNGDSTLLGDIFYLVKLIYAKFGLDDKVIASFDKSNPTDVTIKLRDLMLMR